MNEDDNNSDEKLSVENRQSLSVETRLEIARQQREKVLAERAAQKRPPTPKSDAPDTQPPWHKRIKFPAFPSAARTKALIAFSAATGLGLGLALGIGFVLMVSDWRAPPSAEAGQVSQATFVFPDKDLASPEWPETTPKSAPTSGAIIKAVQQMPAQVAEPPAPAIWLQPATVSAPEQSEVASAPDWQTLSPVSYLRTDLSETRAAELRRVAAPSEMLRGVTPLGAEKPLVRGRVFIHAPTSVPRDELSQLQDDLQAVGMDVARVGRESFRVSQTHVRYYSDETRAVAQAVAQGLGVEARDFSDAVRENDRIELWLAGRGPIRSASTPSRSNNPFARFFQALSGQ